LKLQVCSRGSAPYPAGGSASRPQVGGCELVGTSDLFKNNFNDIFDTKKSLKTLK